MHPPPPRAPSVAVVPKLEAVVVSPESFVAPSRRVLNRLDLAKWQASPARAHLLGFVRTLADAARGVSLSADVHVSPAASAVIAVLEELQARSRPWPTSPLTSAAAHTHVRPCWLCSVGWMLFHRFSRQCGMETPRSGPGVCLCILVTTAESRRHTRSHEHALVYLDKACALSDRSTCVDVQRCVCFWTLSTHSDEEVLTPSSSPLPRPQCCRLSCRPRE